MNYKYSVIIPIYKAQGTLKRCVDSLLIQNYADAEIILVNDGSPDDCGRICEEYAAKHPQVKYIAKENGGVSSARNAGLDVAEGKYIMFVDSDDYVAENCFKEIDRAFEGFDWDYLLLSNYLTDGKSVEKKSCSAFEAKSVKETAMRIADEINRGTINTPWAKVYKREIIESVPLRYNERLSIAEDWSFNVRYAVNISSVCRVDYPMYYVSIENENSLSRRVIPNYYEQHEASAADVREALENCAFTKEQIKPIIQRINFGEYRAIYTKAKIQHRQKLNFIQRIKTIRAMCKAVNARKYEIPKTRNCRLISLPVKLNFALAIDIITWVLVRR